jgi:NAD(P)-dependent dehydrogenase (short-subunit alcohol dehydrogenase family)
MTSGSLQLIQKGFDCSHKPPCYGNRNCNYSVIEMEGKMGKLENKNVLITGGTRGIGLATAQEFEREGARVAICGTDEKALKEARSTLGPNALAFRADVSKLSDLDSLYSKIKAEFGHLDVVFANAGFSQFGPFEAVEEDTFDKLIAVNLKGTFFTIQKAVPLLKSGSSVIVNSSVTVKTAWPTTTVMSAIKAGISIFARTMSAELADRKIRVNALSPGPTDTEMFGRVHGEKEGDAIKDVLGGNNPSKRLAEPLEIAKLAVYLASDDSIYVVGADFAIDGGAGAFSRLGG